MKAQCTPLSGEESLAICITGLHTYNFIGTTCTLHLYIQPGTGRTHVSGPESEELGTEVKQWHAQTVVMAIEYLAEDFNRSG